MYSTFSNTSDRYLSRARRRTTTYDTFSYYVKGWWADVHLSLVARTQEGHFPFLRPSNFCGSHERPEKLKSVNHSQ